MGLHLFFLPNFPVATFIPDSRVPRFISDRDSDTEIFVKKKIKPPVHRGRRPWQNKILILVFFRLRAQFYTYENTLDILQVFPSGLTCLKLCFS